MGSLQKTELQSTLGGMHVLKTNGLARLHNGDEPALSLGFKLLILFARNFLSVLYCPFPEATPNGLFCLDHAEFREMRSRKWMNSQERLRATLS